MVTVYRIAKAYNKLPYEIKQIPWTELTEMAEMANLQHRIMGE